MCRITGTEMPVASCNDVVVSLFSFTIFEMTVEKPSA
jgi:hypothetical protein